MFHEHRVTTRKEHVCIGCQFRFPPKVTLWKRAYVFDGGFHSDYLCEICYKFLHKNRRDFCDGFEEGELFWEGWRHDADFISQWLSKNKPLSVLKGKKVIA
ncbi:MAG: hypothetical protein IPK63_15570 [Candidatus Competibacteraceae bacterium]|nr:hypothetical protein [Candidatus Competibacteraceae bacterium]